MFQGEHSAILSTVIKLPFAIKIFVLSVLSGRFNQVLLYDSEKPFTLRLAFLMDSLRIFIHVFYHPKQLNLCLLCCNGGRDSAITSMVKTCSRHSPFQGR